MDIFSRITKFFSAQIKTSDICKLLFEFWVLIEYVMNLKSLKNWNKKSWIFFSYSTLLSSLSRSAAFW